MNFQVGNTCYETQQQAAQSVASTVGGTVVVVGPDVFVVSVNAVTSNTIAYDFNRVNGDGQMQILAPYTAQPCNMLSAADGIEVGWTIAAIWLGVYAILFLSRAFVNKHKDDDYGNT